MRFVTPSEEDYWIRRAGRGFWAGLVAGPATSLNRTGLGVALYDDEHDLARWCLEPYDRAVTRGDLPAEMAGRRPSSPPTTVDDMRRRLGSTANASSIVRWDGLMPTRAWDEETLDLLFAIITGRDQVNRRP